LRSKKKLPQGADFASQRRKERLASNGRMDEAKSDYEVYHKDYSGAVQAAIKQAEKRGYEVDMDDWHDKVATGPKKPSSGKTNSFSVNLMKDGKASKKKLQMQVYNMDDHKYELNMYIEETEQGMAEGRVSLKQIYGDKKKLDQDQVMYGRMTQAEFDKKWTRTERPKPTDIEQNKKQGVAEGSGDKKPYPNTWHDVDPKIGKLVDKMSPEEKVKKGYANPSILKKNKKQGVAEGDIDEAEYQGRNVPLGKKMAGDVKKSKVYVKNPQGNVVKVNFGDKKMRIKKSNPARRKSFRARHNCANPGPRHKARYWSCRSW
jgi:hypothetical protein